MGVAITDLLIRKPLQLDSLSGKVIAIDAHLFLYQFLSTIRQPDGTPLTDSKGNVTSHLSGLFFRSTKLMGMGMRLIYVFDGKPPELKKKELERRKLAKSDARAEYNKAVEEQDVDAMGKYAKRTSRLTPDMIKESKELLEALGIPVVEAPSEGEAQAAQLVKEGVAYAVASQDADAFLFGAPRVVRNLSLLGKKKLRSKLAFETYKPELVELQETLNTLGINQEQLIALGMLVGTDFHPGIMNIGPKKALKLVKEYPDLDKLFTHVKWDEPSDIPWKTVYEVFSLIPVQEKLKIEWKTVDEDMVKNLLVTKHDFTEERIMASLLKLIQEKEKVAQRGLGEYF